MKLQNFAGKVILLVLFTSMPIYLIAADGPYTLDECLNKAESSNPELLREKEIYSEYQNGYSASRGALLPQVDASLVYQRYEEQLPSKKALFGPSLDDYYSDVSLKQMLFSGGKFMAQLRSSRAMVDAQQQRVEQIHRDLTLSINKAYFEQLRALHALEIQKNVLEKLSQQRVVAQLLYNGGKTSVVDVLRIQTNESAQQDAVKNAENQVYVKALALGQAMGVKAPVEAALSMPRVNEAAVYEKEIPEAVLDANPRMLYAAKTIEKNNFEVAAAKAEHYPAIYLKGVIFKEDKMLSPNDTNSYAGLFLSLPIYRGDSLSAQTDKARSRSRQAQETARETRLSLYARYASAVSVALDKKDRLSTSAKTVDLARETWTASELRYSSGKISVVDLLDAQNLWSNANLSYINLVFDYLESAAEVKAIWPDAIKGDILK